MTRIKAIFLTLLLTLTLLAASGILPRTAEARPGGGHSSSSHSSSRSSSSSSSSSWHSSSSHSPSWGNSGSYSGGGGGSSLDSATQFWLLIVLIIVIIIMIYIMTSNNPPKSISSRPNQIIRARQNSVVSQSLAKLQEHDPNFSSILLLDFIHLLYSKLYQYAGRPEFSYLSPFLGEELLQQHAFLKPQPAEEVVINGIQWESVTQSTEQDCISLLIDANYTQQVQGKPTRYAINERWLLCRQAGLLSPEPQQMQALSCPHCAAPAHFNDAGVCPYCQTLLHKGEAQWYLHKRVITYSSVLDTGSLVSYATEQGTELATIKQPDLKQRIEKMQRLHALQDWESYFTTFQERIVKAYFLAIYAHWSARNWEGVRHLLSDRLYEANQFWTDRYKQHNWFNRLDKLSIQRIELAKLDIDRYYEAITIRIFASCYDYTEDAQGKLLGGSKRSLREYSEYWTFVRRIHSEKNTETPALNQCPQCGAPADKMGQAAECGYCGSKISTGEFSWVLFLIMQDDVYNG
ncbi:MAG: TIM44-like domain-containing protein [Methylococcales bacterium]|nr:TIM44-like domain-containing protein [Methylococcales bacterium]